MAEPSESPASGSREMTFSEHLGELRSRLTKIAVFVLVGSGICYGFWSRILKLLTGHPLSRVARPPTLIYTAPVEAFMISFKIALFGGVVLSAPLILYQIWAFISPGLYLKERRTIVGVVFASTFFFASGVVFCFWFVLPLAFRFLLNFYTVNLMPMIAITEYIGFILKLLLAFGIVFEMPVFAFVLARLGLVSHTFLIKKIRYAIVIIVIISAIVTPPDLLSPVLMAIPMLLLYALSIGVAYSARRKNA